MEGNIIIRTNVLNDNFCSQKYFLDFVIENLNLLDVTLECSELANPPILS